jgi:hypothetical protein
MFEEGLGGMNARVKNAENSAEHFANTGRRIRHQYDASPGAADNQQFGGLHQYPGIPPFHEETANHGGEDQENSDDSQHKGCLLPYRPKWDKYADRRLAAACPAAFS